MMRFGVSFLPWVKERQKEKEKEMKSQIEATVLSQRQLATGIYDMWIEAGEEMTGARPGQFVTLYCEDGARILPRPISLCEIDGTRIRLVYRTAGAGTREFAQWQAGRQVRLMGPLGNGFPIREENALLIGGGIGIPPLLELAKRLPGQKTAVLGYRDRELFLREEFSLHAPVEIATEDGSAGVKGNVLDVIRQKSLEAQVIYACGPTPMLRAVKAYALEKKIRCYLSLEERMACGIGACLACVCRSTEVDEHTGVHNKRICKDGPVFEAREVEL